MPIPNSIPNNGTSNPQLHAPHNCLVTLLLEENIALHTERCYYGVDIRKESSSISYKPTTRQRTGNELALLLTPLSLRSIFKVLLIVPHIASTIIRVVVLTPEKCPRRQGRKKTLGGVIYEIPSRDATFLGPKMAVSKMRAKEGLENGNRNLSKSRFRLLKMHQPLQGIVFGISLSALVPNLPAIAAKGLA
ncbi:uncharacterized protein ARMOST_17628 [Armillaria ostoyae]|uniref:Uncharacterized protein n=1 Tax=Armillaria ostoyae TaxID=47428 RepID=A0A284RZI1_ARMOS|nr:uncharacterized protein ARMOST_17628 [Armillaria ostoyae]